MPSVKANSASRKKVYWPLIGDIPRLATSKPPGSCWLKGYNQASPTNEVREDANEVQSPRKRQPPHPSQGESLWAVPTVPDEPLFLAGEIAGREDEKLARAQRDASLTLRSLRRLPGSILGAAITRDYTEQGVTSLIGQTIRTGPKTAV